MLARRDNPTLSFFVGIFVKKGVLKLSIILEENGILANDFEQKAKKIIAELDRTVFANLNENTIYEDDEEESKPKKKKKFLKNEILPMITPAMVDLKLAQLMRVYRPMNENEARQLSDMDYLSAFHYYLDIMLHINKYLVYLPDKQTYCAFCNITDDIYNNFMQDNEYMQVFKGIDNNFIHSNFNASQSGLADNKTILTKLQTKDAGYNLVKNPEAITYNDNRVLNIGELDERLDKFMAQLKPPKK